MKRRKNHLDRLFSALLIVCSLRVQCLCILKETSPPFVPRKKRSILAQAKFSEHPSFNEKIIFINLSEEERN